jgi:Outer membrane protein beta-barrel family
MGRMKRLLFLLLFFGIAFPLLAQETDLHGIIQMNTSVPLEGVHIWLYNLADTTKPYVTSTTANGVFHIINVQRGVYRFEAHSVGYTKITQVIRVNNPNADLGSFTLTETPIKYGDVVIRGRVPPAVQKGDTTEFNANAYKTHPDATVEELVTKMPGVTVDNTTGTVQAGGETVQRVLVDGKPFFGDDPTIAMRNLPAEVVDKIQVFDQLSEQAQFTGFDDGQYTKTMNIVTRQRNASSEFGKLIAGYGDDGRYNAGGNMNFFDGNSRVSLLGSSNNINTQNFSAQDLLGVLSGSGQRSGGGRGGGGGGQRQGGRPRGGMFIPGGGNSPSNLLIGQQQGINTTSMLGGNFSDTALTNTFVHANYFFNQTNNQNDQSLTRQYLIGDSSTDYDQQSDINGKNKNHRVNMRVDYALDESNFFTITPQLLFQDNSTINLQNVITSLPSGQQLSQSQTTNQTATNGNSLSGHVLFKHKFSTPGRTISLDMNISESLKKSSGDLLASNMYGNTTIDSSSYLNDQSGGTWQSISISPSLVYTEPLGVTSQLEINYQPTFSKGTADKRTYNYDTMSLDYSLFNPILSNTYDNQYTSQRAGVAYRFSKQGINLNIGVAYQQADLWNQQTFPLSTTVSRTFSSALPNVMFNMRIGNRENLRFYYQTATRAPSITQLQNVVDNSNPLLLSAGNSDLKQSYTHTLMARYSITAPEEGKSLFLLLSANYTLDYIGSASITPGRDTVVLGTLVAPGVQLTMPQNFTDYWSVRSFMTYGFPLDIISSTMNLNAGVNYAQTPGSINSLINIADATTYTLGAVIGSNISENLDFTVTYSGNYNTSSNSLQSSLNSDYYSHTAGLRFNWIFWDGIVFHDELLNVYNNGQSTGYNQNSLLWNMSLAKKLFSKQSGEIKVSVYDVLGQNKSLNRTIASSYIEDSRNEVLTRYYMLTFTYTVR